MNQVIKYCKCGCGAEIAPDKIYKHGHNGRIKKYNQTAVDELNKLEIIEIEVEGKGKVKFYKDRFCACGCGERIEVRKYHRDITDVVEFVHGHNAVGKTWNLPPRTQREKDQRSKTLKRKYASGEIVAPMLGKEGASKGKTWEEFFGEEKAAEMRKGVAIWTKTPEAIKKISESKLGKTLKELGHKENCSCCICKAKRGEMKGENNPFFGKKHSFTSIQKMMDSMDLRPTGYETRIISLIEEQELPYKYVGDGNFWVNVEGRHLNPDFVHKEKRIVIEVYADFHKVVSYGSSENYERERSRLFGLKDFQVIFISEKIMEDKNWELFCLELLMD